MPLRKRSVEPTELSRIEVDKKISNELECVTNSTLANIVRQLSSLSNHASDLFSELSQEANSCFQRTSQLQQRIDSLRKKVTDLDPTVEEVSLQDIHLRKPYRSSVGNDQQVISRSTIPRAILDLYSRCDRPPALQKLDPYREDNKESIKFYTDPTYFFELWYAEMKKEIEQNKCIIKKKKQRPKPDTPQKGIKKPTTSRDQNQEKAMGAEFVRQQKHDLSQRLKESESSEKSPNSRSIHPPVKEDPSQPRPNSLDVQHNSNIPGGGHEYLANQHQDSYLNMNGPVDQAVYSRNEQDIYRHQMANHSNTGSPQSIVQMSRSPSRASSNVASPVNRPSQPPPAPPPGIGGILRQSPARDDLPPPPPPPPVETDSVHGRSQHQPHSTQIQQQILKNEISGSPGKGSPRNSPARQASALHQHRSQDHSEILPPPPPPPLNGTPDTPESQISMPPLPSPPYVDPIEEIAVCPPPPPTPPPPPPPPVLHQTSEKGLPNGNIPSLNQVDRDSISSSSSITTTSSSDNRGGVTNVTTGRSALLEEIRMYGDRQKQLKSVEVRERNEFRNNPSGRLDVQTLMDKAFRMRRAAVELSDSDGDSDTEWDT